MYGHDGLQRYREADINSMTKEKMVVLLYEKMVSDLQEAEAAIAAGRRVDMTQRINHSQRIVSELRNALDHSAGNDVTRNLESLYDYLFHEHLNILVDQDPTHIQNCIVVLNPLLDAWRQIPAGTAETASLNRNAAGPEHASDEPNAAGVSADGAVSGGAPTPETAGLLSVSA